MGRGMMGWGPAPTAPPETSVRMAGSRFDPATLTIAVGETVRWFNDDSLPHTVTAADGSWDSGNLPPGASSVASTRRRATGTCAATTRHDRDDRCDSALRGARRLGRARTSGPSMGDLFQPASLPTTPV